MVKSLQLLRPDLGSDTAETGPNLLVHLESVPRAFFGNFAELFRPSPLNSYPKPGRFWGDVFVQSSPPWWRVFESMLWHALIIAAFVSLSKFWTPREHVVQQLISHSQVTYYKPSMAFPALGNSGPSMAPKPRESERSARPGATRVASQRSLKVATPPQLKAGKSQPGRVPDSNHPLPAMPLSATARSQLTAQAGPNSIVAPPPEVDLGISSRPGLAQPSGIGPAPNIITFSPERRTLNAPGLAGIAPPPPEMPASVRNLGDINIAPSEAVAPSPNLPMHEQRTGSGARGKLGNSGASVVPPSPSLSSSGGAGGGRSRSLSGAGLSGTSYGVVPPAPSASETGSTGTRHGRSFSNGDSQVIAPAPSLETAGGSGQLGGRRPGALSGGNSEIVPPTPSVAGEGGTRAGSGGLGSLSAAGLEAVPPAPSVTGGGGSTSGGNGNSLDSASQVVPPAPSSPSTGNSRASDRPVDAAASASAAPQATPTKEQRRSPPEDLALRLVGLVLALPNSSYFSNYEVFIAERRVGRENPEFIKLVYEYLPYQRALSQYENNSKIFKLRVTRDSSCDESLMQMTWPENDPHPQGPSDSPGLSASDRNSMLPCYRTTADDYRKAISRRH